MRRYLTLSVLLLLAGLAACGGDDPAAPAAVPTLRLDAASAEEWTLASLEIANGLVSAVPAFAAGDFSAWTLGVAKNADEPVWDPSQQAYVYSFAGPVMELEAPNHFLAAIDLWVQYRAGGTPVQAALGADEMEVATSFGMDMHMEDGDTVADLDYLAEVGLLVAFEGAETGYGVTGAGTNTVEVSNVSPQGSEHGRFTVAWTLDLVVAPDGCAAGTATVTAQDWTLAAAYDGAGGVAWQLTGPGYSASGTEDLECGVAR